jgi:hypothetical protein
MMRGECHARMRLAMTGSRAVLSIGGFSTLVQPSAGTAGRARGDHRERRWLRARFEAAAVRALQSPDVEMSLGVVGLDADEPVEHPANLAAAVESHLTPPCCCRTEDSPSRQYILINTYQYYSASDYYFE